MTGMALWIMLGVLLPVILITAVTPIITRKTEAFGVTIPEQVKSQAYIAGHIKRYMTICIGLGVIVLVALYFLLRQQWSEAAVAWSYTAFVLGYSLAAFIAYYTTYRAIKSWKQNQPWYTEQLAVQKIVVQTNFHHKRFAISLVWYIPHLLAVVLTMGYSLIRYDDFPQMLPMKYSFSGEVTQAVEKSLQSVLTISFIALAIIAVFLVAHFSIIKSKQIVESHDPEGSLERNRIFRYAWSVYSAAAGFLVIITMCIGQLTPLQIWDYQMFMVITAIAIGLVLLGAIVLSIKLGQGGSRIVLKQGKGETTVSTADLDKYWKAGIFYFNPNDPAIFVEKRFGVGWTINIGNVLSWLVFLGILALVLIPSFLLGK